MLKHKNIILGISGGIAAYKCAELVRLFIKEGADVKVIMTPSAADFVTAKTLSVLSKNEVLTDFFTVDANWNNHVALAEWAHLIVIAPVTANTLSKMANGSCDNLLLATYFSARTPVFVAPAMDLEMYQHKTVKVNLEKVNVFGNIIIPPGNGELASGLTGEGRMAEPSEIVTTIINHLSAKLPLRGINALINAGPTYEAIDPVRFIGNRSSGKMGMAIAECLASKGANVVLVLGPSSLKTTLPNIEVIPVESTDDMYAAMLNNYSNKDLVICSAAVADYKPAQVSDQKLKKQSGPLHLNLVKTTDILHELGLQKKEQLLVGFALETENLINYAIDKLKNKNLDLVIANAANEAGSGFSGDANKISIIDKHNKITNFELKSKQEVSADIVNYIIPLLKKNG